MRTGQNRKDHLIFSQNVLSLKISAKEELISLLAALERYQPQLARICNPCGFLIALTLQIKEKCGTKQEFLIFVISTIDY